MSRKILSIFLSLLVVLTSTGIAAFANDSAQIVASSIVVEQGTRSVDITVSLKNNPGIVSAKLSVAFNSDVLTLTKIEDAGVLGSTSHSPSLESPYNLYWNNGSATKNFVVDGTIVTLTFNIIENAPIGTYPINLYYDEDNILDVNMDSINFNTIDGMITINDTINTNPFTKTTITEDGKTFKITSTNIPAGKTVILALYNGDKFLEMQSTSYEGNEISFTTTKDYTKAKVMVWDNFITLRPVCDVEIVK